MKTVLCNIMFVFLMMPAWAEETPMAGGDQDLMQAYQREILFLSTYKKELQEKLGSLDAQLGKKARLAKTNLNTLEKQWLLAQTNNELQVQKIADLERDFEFKKENVSMLEAAIEQASLSLSPEIKQDGESLSQGIEKAFSEAVADLAKSQKIRKQKGKYYLESGAEKEGDVIFLGSVARFATDGSQVAALYPSGGGAFKVWQWLGREADPMIAGEFPKELSFFLYESADKEYVAKQEKNWLETIQSGGSIAWLIVVMGMFALFMSIARFMLLKKAGRVNKSGLQKALEELRNDHAEEAQAYVMRENSSVGRVVAKTLGYLKTEPQKVEDAIAESILEESRTIDRFGVVILVIASVAPLMGLLGTVTGMISTFDVITVYGTGNPKLLSGGISEALVTTMLGLIVAIPALLIGQYLGSMSENIKGDMEKWALSFCNAFKNRQELR
ncbi:MAG: MotA/TolQ/ExbB proton channel family protein [Bdellovibrionales bacterium]|nr:MotA/TolQ/ExbB proton channel family protein [Bdellovibrionales bacterium]